MRFLDIHQTFQAVFHEDAGVSDYNFTITRLRRVDKPCFHSNAAPDQTDTRIGVEAARAGIGALDYVFRPLGEFEHRCTMIRGFLDLPDLPTWCPE